MTLVALTYVVTSAVVPQYTFEEALKFVPVAVSVNPTTPATAEVLSKDVSVGPFTVHVTAVDLAVVEFCTVMLAAPVARSCAAVTAAVTLVALT